MSCILRVYGETLDIKALLALLEIVPYQWWEKGDLISIGGSSTETFNYSGAKFEVSEADMDLFELQIDEAISFLQENQGDILKISSFAGVEDVILDFAIGDTFTHTDNLSPKFLSVVGNLGIGVALSHYPTCEDDKSQ